MNYYFFERVPGVGFCFDAEHFSRLLRRVLLGIFQRRLGPGTTQTLGTVLVMTLMFVGLF